MTVINIHGNNNEVNAILNSSAASLGDNEDITGNLNTGTARIDFSRNFFYILDISGNYHDANVVRDSSGSLLTDGNEVINNSNLTGFSVI
tara:strand:+ start:1265 stop:1534 length:270 start_codon:yes stop_codon:yes gene_type:complete